VKSAKIVNLMARSFIVFLVAYLWLSFYFRDLISVFVYSFLIMLGVNFVLRLLPKKRAAQKPVDYIKVITPPRQINHVFERRKVRTYLVLGAVIFLTSFIVRFSIFYIIFATIMFSFAFISLFVVYSNNDTQDVV
jgi:hypothetical protein